MESHLNSKTLFLVLFFLTFAQTCYGAVLFSSLPQTLLVSASPKEGQVVKAGEDSISMSWGLNQSYERGVDESYKTTKVKLCYAPESQADRGWRKTVDDLSKDKTCQFSIVERPYYSSEKNQSFEWMIETDVPTALYFVRAYAYDSAGNEVAYGHTIALFKVQATSGRHLSLDIAAACFSGFALVSVFGFFFAEKRGRRLMAANN
ncbi:PREDICTED: high-affinity nitrate transporter-activating protein 2.1-like [Ipomoea nil]|uniref:high-affinity nitrate transporter-activating protein 2.1-like n=1 Tax=Ipomoea nil TaxID=35883 RepID=UPI0009018A10|nr:PREDICTED: high-affinity nitrate transporter-activating protein 2.1-like [Ipomoea nil]XP_019160922.1 PREDICTED: high-affinity nitrate transporter-activating protein 2.1-like [Ipomoea nil]